MSVQNRIFSLFSEGCLSLFFGAFFARLQNSEKRLLALSSLSVRPSLRLSVSPSVRVEQRGSSSADFHEILYLRFLSKICWPHYNVTRTLGTLCEDQCTFMVSSR